MRGVSVGRHDAVKQGRGGGYPPRAAVVSVVIIAALLLVTNTMAAASNLSTQAAQMAPGTFVELTGMTNWDSGGILTPSGCGRQDAITQYANTAVWNPIAKRFQFSGSPHAPCSGTNEKAVFYDDAANSWGTLPNPNSSANDPRHSYGHNALNPATGEHYYHNYNSTQNLRLANGGSGWQSLASFPNSTQCCNSQAFFPDRNSLLRWDGSFGLYEYSPSSNSWTARAGAEVSISGLPGFSCGSVCQPSWSLYSVRCRCIIFGNGPVLEKFNSDGTFTALTHAGGPSSINISPSGNASVVVDPVSGFLIVIVQGGTMFVLDPGATNTATGTWSRGPAVPSFFNAGNGVNESLISAPISTYGVVMYVKHDDSGTGRVFLYKHAPSTPPVIPGVPGNVVAR
jgi:hypothetical protein